MSNFTESLTIRILGDSSHLDRELERVMRRMEDVGGRLSRLGDVGPALADGLDRLSGLERPLGGVSRTLDRVLNQVRTLSRMPITLNVAPALGALGALARMIDFLAAKLRMLSSIPVGIGAGGGGIPGGTPALPRTLRAFASGGLVTGALGVDRVPALLTAGEFVLRRPVVERLGLPALNDLNRGASATRDGAAATSPAGATTVNHFGGIEIHVAQPGGVNELVRDLRLQGFRLRNRRG